MAWFFFKKFLLSHHSESLTRIISRLCIVGVLVAISAMVVILSVMGGFGDHIEKRLLAYEPHLTIQSKQSSDLEKFKFELKKNKNLSAFLVDQQEVIVRNVDGLYSGGLVQGIEQDSINKILETAREQADDTQINNKNLNELLKTNEVIIGADLAHSIGAYPGDRIVITPPETLLLPPGEVPTFLTLNVKNVVRTNIPELDSQVIYYNRDTNSQPFKDAASLEHLIEVYLNDLNKVNDLKIKWEQQGFLVQTWKDRNSTLYYSLKMERILIGFFLGLALFIGSFSILNVLLLLSIQKRQDIGVLKAMGMTASKIQALFTKLGFILSGIGIIGGLGLGLIICYVLDTFPIIKLPDVYYDRTIPVRYELHTYMLIVALAFAVTLFSSWFPAHWSSRVVPSEALRKR